MSTEERIAARITARLAALEAKVFGTYDKYTPIAKPAPPAKPLPTFSEEEHRAVFALVRRMLELQPLEHCTIEANGNLLTDSGVIIAKKFANSNALALYGFVCAWLRVRNGYILNPTDGSLTWGVCTIGMETENYYKPTLSEALAAYLDHAEGGEG